MPPYHYVTVTDPVMRDQDSGEPLLDKHGQVKVKQGDSEIRTSQEYQEPFPLYPGESVSTVVRLPVIARNNALKLECIRDYVDEQGKKKNAGDEWLVEGPKIYTPNVHVRIAKRI